jgi:hypothetical protein
MHCGRLAVGAETGPLFQRGSITAEDVQVLTTAASLRPKHPCAAADTSSIKRLSHGGNHCVSVCVDTAAYLL